MFLTSGRGLSHEAAGVAVAAYWAMMLVGRAALGPLAERVGSSRPLMAAVVGVAVGAAVMSLPAPGSVAVVGMMTLGFLVGGNGRLLRSHLSFGAAHRDFIAQGRIHCPANRCLPGA